MPLPSPARAGTGRCGSTTSSSATAPPTPPLPGVRVAAGGRRGSLSGARPRTPPRCCAGRPRTCTRTPGKPVLVTDDLNTHGPRCLYEALAPARARQIAERPEWRYTPRHGSWLNLAEVELAALGKQCPGRRLGSLAELAREGGLDDRDALQGTSSGEQPASCTPEHPTDPPPRLIGQGDLQREACDLPCNGLALSRVVSLSPPSGSSVPRSAKRTVRLPLGLEGLHAWSVERSALVIDPPDACMSLHLFARGDRSDSLRTMR
jgi:hypothetical protein